MELGIIITVWKNDLINMIRGTSPGYHQINHLTTLGLGSYNGSHDVWNWSSSSATCWEKMSKEELLNLYNILTGYDIEQFKQ